MSRQFLGIQIDAVYHTAIVFGGVEYLFGQGVQTCIPGTTHHGGYLILPIGSEMVADEIRQANGNHPDG
jgi:hypothetical protein